MSETPEQPQVPEIPAGLADAYWNRFILAGFLSTDDLYRVYPQARSWPQELAANVASLFGRSQGLASRPEAGQVVIRPVEEPEALEVLHPEAQNLRFGAETPIGFAWVEIANLITPSAVTSPLPHPATLPADNPQEIALYSMYVSGPPPQVFPGGMLLSSFPLNVAFKGAGLVQGQLVVQYELSHPLRPIIVGYEQGRCYLLNAYGRVLHALNQGVGRLLCMVYYGLDLNALNLGVKLPWLQGAQINHFGAARLSEASAPPVIRDFLDPTLSAIVPTRAGLHAFQPSLQSLAINV